MALFAVVIACTCVGPSFVAPAPEQTDVPTDVAVSVLARVGARPLLVGDGVIAALTTVADPLEPIAEHHLLSPVEGLTPGQRYEVVDGNSSVLLSSFTVGAAAAPPPPSIEVTALDAEILPLSCVGSCVGNGLPSWIGVAVAGGSEAAWLEVDVSVNGAPPATLAHRAAEEIELGTALCRRRGPPVAVGDEVCVAVRARSAAGVAGPDATRCTTVTACAPGACLGAPACAATGDGCSIAPTAARGRAGAWPWGSLCALALVGVAKVRAKRRALQG